MIILRNELDGIVDPDAFLLDGCRVEEHSSELAEAIAERDRELRERYATPGDAVDLFQPARRLYRGLGIDPTKHRPSSEALVRRVIQGKGLYTINTAVDAANLTCLHHFLPVGLYDADRIRGEPVVLRTGRPGEGYEGLGKGRIDLEGRALLADDEGPFGNPSADSRRTSVHPGTTRLFFVLFAPVDLDADDRRDRLAICRTILPRHVGGTLL